MSNLTPLIQALQEATGPSRELDARIYCALPSELPRCYYVANLDGSVTTYRYSDGRDDAKKISRVAAAHFTASIDAITALVKLKLPGWMYRVATCSVSDDAWVAPDFNDPIYGKELLALFPGREIQSDPIEALDLDVDLRPPGREAIALCIAFLLGYQAYLTALQAGGARNG